MKMNYCSFLTFFPKLNRRGGKQRCIWVTLLDMVLHYFRPIQDLHPQSDG